MPQSPPGDVGGWFRTALDDAPAPSPRRGWAPAGPDLYGLESPDDDLAAALARLRGRRVLVVTGAGMSTGSGLPDYRGRDARPRSPMTFQEFTGQDLSRRRYWARSTVGWPMFLRAWPGPAHHALTELERRLNLTGVVTQNVDRLHQAAGSRTVVDLHGRLDHVVCLGCRTVSSRRVLQTRLLALNPDMVVPSPSPDGPRGVVGHQAPDGDADVEEWARFRYPDCSRCGGLLKPDVVFFGENAHRPTVEAAFALYERADAVLVLGSSLTVMSGLRFARKAVRDEKPVVIAGDGPTRGDDLATHRIHGRLEHILPRWIAMLDES